jgi:hypothetical protein
LSIEIRRYNGRLTGRMKRKVDLQALVLIEQSGGSQQVGLNRGRRSHLGWHPQDAPNQGEIGAKSMCLLLPGQALEE